MADRARNAGRGERGTPFRGKITHPLLVQTLRRYREEALAREPADPDAMDRRRVLARLCAELEAEPEELALRGFDRAYRLTVEGV